MEPVRFEGAFPACLGTGDQHHRVSSGPDASWPCRFGLGVKADIPQQTLSLGIARQSADLLRAFSHHCGELDSNRRADGSGGVGLAGAGLPMAWSDEVVASATTTKAAP